MSIKFFQNNKGYKIIDFLNNKEITDILNKITKQINKSQKKILFSEKNLKFLHKKEINSLDYKKIIDPKNRKIKININKFNLKIKKTNILQLIKSYWGHKNIKIVWVGSAKKKQIKNNEAGFRIARPGVNSDAALEHIDLYNKDDKSFLTLWIPLIGFSSKYSLKLYPGTHKMIHNLKNFKNKTRYISRVFKKEYFTKFRSIRPNLKKGQAIIFHPNVIHGGSVNNGKWTRISIEIRILNNKKFNLKKTFEKKLFN